MMLNEINDLKENQLLNTSLEDLADYFVNKYEINPIELKERDISVEDREISVDVSQEPGRDIFNRNRPFYVKETEIIYYVPFEGEYKLFYCSPSSYTSSPPRGTVNEYENLLKVNIRVKNHDTDNVKKQFERNLDELKKYLQWVKSDAMQFNSTIRQKAKQRIEVRRQKILKDKGLVANLGFPLKDREDVQETYIVPVTRKKVPISVPPASTTPFVPEPSLDMKEYENILAVISNMVMVMERSPKAFSGMGEEDLRQHFLVQLNARYEGQATGETFNFEGKTDIIIRVKNKNIFIAECKFWNGDKYFNKAIDQLINYASWRDTKIALLVFNRKKNLSMILEKIPKLVEAHSNYKRKLDYNSETGFRYIISHRDDQNREMTLTVLFFEVPE